MPSARIWRRAAVAGGLGLAGVYAFEAAQYHRTAGKGFELEDPPAPGTPDFARMVEALTVAPLRQGNRVTMLRNGAEIFPAMLEAIRSAERSINFATYVYWTGSIAPEFAEALAERSEAGVEVNVLLDAVGAAKMERALIDRLDAAGAKVAWFRPAKWYTLHKLNNRTHRKILVVDGRARTAEGFNKTYGIVHPLEQWESNRNVRLSPFHSRERELDAVFFEAAGWERPQWYESNAQLLEEFGDRVGRREAEWDARWWSPIINAEHLAMRDRAGLFDLSAFAIFDVSGPGALDALQRVSMRQVDVSVGRVVYTPWLSKSGGFKSDLTIMRLGDELFRVVTGGAHGMADKKWLHDHLPEDGSAQLADLTSAWCTLGIWGPRARDILASVTSDDVSHEGFPFGTCRTIEIGPLRVLASRISYVGDLGWELYVPIEQGARLWDILWEAGSAHGAVPVGIGVYGTTGRLEKCYRAYGTELESEYTVVEAGMGTPKVKEQDFVGREAYLEAREEEPATILCTLTVDDHASSNGVARFPQGREPVVTSSGERIVDDKGRGSYVTSAGAGPSVGKHILMAYLPPEHAEAGAKLAVEYMGDRYPITVAVAGPTPLFDPENVRVRS